MDLGRFACLLCHDIWRQRRILWGVLLGMTLVCGMVGWYGFRMVEWTMGGDAQERQRFGRYHGEWRFPSEQNRRQALDILQDEGAVCRHACALQADVAVDMDNGPDERQSSSPWSMTGLEEGEHGFPLKEGRWFQFPRECVIQLSGRDDVESRRGMCRVPRVGDIIQVKTDRGRFALRVTGIVGVPHGGKSSRQGEVRTFSFGFGVGIGGGRAGQPERRKASGRTDVMTMGQPPSLRPSEGGLNRLEGMVGRGPSLLYVSCEDAAAMLEHPVYALFIEWKQEQEEGMERWHSYARRFSKGGLQAEMQVMKTPVKGVEEREKGMMEQIVGTVGTVCVSGFFIVVVILNVHVSMRRREIARMKAVGVRSWQLMIGCLAEGTLLGLGGWLGGLALALMMLGITDGFLLHGCWMSRAMGCMAAGTFLCSVGGSFILSVIPACRILFEQPEEMARWPHHRRLRQRDHVMTLLGMLCFVLPWMIGKGMHGGALSGKLVYATGGSMAIIAGMLLTMPCVMVVVERLCAPWLAMLFCFHKQFLYQVLSGARWRTAGMAIALTLGLGLYVAMVVWSHSMLSSFTVADEMPDVLIRFHRGMAGKDLKASLRSLPWLDSNRLMEISVSQPQLESMVGERLMAHGAMADNVVLMGVEGALAWNDSAPMLRLSFVEGTRQEVYKAFEKQEDRVCVIPLTLAVHGGLHVGSELPLERVEADGSKTMVGYRIVAVADFPWMWFSKCSGIRVRAARTAGVVFAPSDYVQRDFGAPAGEFYWGDVHGNMTESLMDESLRRIVEKAYEKGMEGVSCYAGGTRWDSGLNDRYYMVSTKERLNRTLNSRTLSVLKEMTRMPIVMILLSVLALGCGMTVSVDLRRWEFGMMQVFGMSRWKLGRLMACETLLIGLVGIVTSLAGGMYYAWLSLSFVTDEGVLGMVSPSMKIPWGQISYGVGISVVVMSIAAVYSVLSTYRRWNIEALLTPQL